MRFKINQTPVVRFVYDRKKQSSKTSKGTIELEVYFNKQRIRLSTGYSVFPAEWNGANVVRHAHAFEINMALLEEKQQIESIIDEHIQQGGFSVCMLKGFSFVKTAQPEEPVNKLPEKDFLEWLKERIELRPIEESTKRQHRVAYDCLKKSGIIKTFSDITVPKIKEWDGYLHSMYNKKKTKNCQTTIHGYHRRLKPYIREAVELGLIEKSPYDIIRINRGKTDKIKYLTVEERDRIENLTLAEGVDTWVRDMFILSCYTGLAYSDLIKIKRKDIFKEGDNYYIIDKRQKTHSSYKIMLLPKATSILKHYNYNMNLVSNEKCNTHLKTLAAKAMIDKNLTFHMGRHTFATWALKSGVGIEVVSKMLAHADIKTTQVYAKVLQV